MVRIYNQDCLVAMKQMKEEYFDLAIVDPPYGIGMGAHSDFVSDRRGGGRKAFKKKEWDKSIPSKEYFDELFRVSKNQIIWGANYFPQYLFGTMGWIFWDKGQNLAQSDGELAFSSFNRAFRRVIINRRELQKEGTIHPTQKPIKLYKWLINNYAQGTDCKILDTHLGSGSSAIAAYDMGYDFTGYEIDKDYFEASEARLNHHMQQGRLFE